MEIIKIVVYSVLVLLCVILFIVFNKKDDLIEPGPDETSTPRATIAQPTPTLPYRLDLMFELLKEDIGCEISAPNKSGGSFKYELIFEHHTDTGGIFLKVDEYDGVTSVTLKRRYLYYGEPTNNGEISNIMRAEYARRLAADKKLLNKFLRIAVQKMDFSEELPRKEVEGIVSDIISAYEERINLDKTVGTLHLIAATDREELYANFSIEISFAE
ncbi:MAG: hypothetical protein J1E60_08130 [Christensenellaceae bacterium]|nr:hypothetical protein [Christensenellaceae bacterium]